MVAQHGRQHAGVARHLAAHDDGRAVGEANPAGAQLGHRLDGADGDLPGHERLEVGEQEGIPRRGVLGGDVAETGAEVGDVERIDAWELGFSRLRPARTPPGR